MKPSSRRQRRISITGPATLFAFCAFLAGCEPSAPRAEEPELRNATPPESAEAAPPQQRPQEGAATATRGTGPGAQVVGADVVRADVVGKGVLEDRWYRVFVDGNPAGVSHRVSERDKEGRIRSVYDQELKIRRGTEPLELHSRLEMREDGDGKIQSFQLVISAASDSPHTIEGTVKGDRIEIARPGPTGAAASTVSVPLDPQARGLHWVDREMARALHAPGDTFTATTFFPERQRCGKVEALAQAIETIQVSGKAQQCLAVVIKNDALPGMDTRVWIDSDSTVWKSEIKAMGMTIQEVLSTTGRPTENAPTRPELLYSTSIRPNRPLKNAGANDSVLYRFSLRDGTFASRGISDVFRASGQTLEGEESPSARLVRIRRVRPERNVEIGSIDRSGKETFLRSNPLIQSDDAEIAAAARQAIGDTAPAFDAARRLALWVHSAIRVKDLSVGFASAKETLKARQGDCTEHGVLLAALARSVGIPARVACGFVYHDGAFVGHLWTEMYIDRWIPFDATRGDASVGPDHILVSSSDLSDTMTSDVFFDLVPILGNLQIDILEP